MLELVVNQELFSHFWSWCHQCYNADGRCINGWGTISGIWSVPTTAIGTDAFQEADIVGISRSCTKWNVMVKNVAELPRRINEAFEIATTGRPGPVLVDLPKDVTASILRESIPINTTLPSNALSQITKSR